MKKILLALLFTLVACSNTSHGLKDSKIQGRLNIVNGNASECMMHKFYTNTGWIKIEGEVGRNGIDGLYYKTKNGKIREVLVAESKWNTSKLGRSGKNKLVKQMSQHWVLRTMDKLERHKPLPQYSRIRRLIEHDQYRARLFKVIPFGKESIRIDIYKLKNKGEHQFDTFVESKLKPINLKAPRNSFEKNMVKSYNSCRSQALTKYFPVLEKDDIDVLLKSNYLKKNKWASRLTPPAKNCAHFLLISAAKLTNMIAVTEF